MRCVVFRPSAPSLPKLTSSRPQFSWTKLEAEIDEKDISPFASTDASAPKDIPRLTILSLSSRTVVHLKENKREIVCAAARVWENGALSPALRR